MKNLARTRSDIAPDASNQAMELTARRRFTQLCMTSTRQSAAMRDPRFHPAPGFLVRLSRTPAVLFENDARRRSSFSRYPDDSNQVIAVSHFL
jgi:hypothetical protein